MKQAFTWRVDFESVPDGMLWFASGVVLDSVLGILKIAKICQNTASIKQTPSIK